MTDDFPERARVTSDSLTLERPNGNGPENQGKGLPFLADLIEDLERILLTYISFPDTKLATLWALWFVQTYCFEAFSYCGYLALRSSTPGCGKTLLLSILSLFSFGKPSIYTNVSGAVLYRIQNQVLFLDEVDKLGNKDREKSGDIQAILNAGFKKGQVVPRCEGRDFRIKEFDVYGPKALAGIESLADPIADRAFHIPMKREKNRRQRFSERKFEEIASCWRENCQRWVDERFTAIGNAYQQIPDEVDALQGYESRFQDISEPIFILSDLADIERNASSEDSETRGFQPILPRLLEGLKVVASKRQPSGREQQMQAFLKVVEPHLNGDSSVFLKTRDLLEECQQCEDLEWIETPRKLANLLKVFELYPDKKREGEETVRGYVIEADWVKDFRERYGS